MLYWFNKDTDFQQLFMRIIKDFMEKM